MRIKLHLTVSKLLNRRRQIKVQCITQGASLKENLKFYIVVANKIWNFWNLFCKIICSKSDFSIQLTVALFRKVMVLGILDQEYIEQM